MNRLHQLEEAVLMTYLKGIAIDWKADFGREYLN